MMHPNLDKVVMPMVMLPQQASLEADGLREALPQEP